MKITWDPPMWLLWVGVVLLGAGFLWLLTEFYRWAYRT